MALGDVQWRHLETATILSAHQVKNAIAPLDVITSLNGQRTGAVLVGTYGLAGWLREPRATQSVEVLLPLRGHEKAVDRLLRAYPQLDAERCEAATDLRDRETDKVAIRLLKPLDRLSRETREQTYRVRCIGRDVKIPSLEMALLLSYVPMMALPWVGEKYLHAHDFISIACVNPQFDWMRLTAIAEVVCPERKEDLLERLKRVQAGGPLNL